ncbi:MAG TPA: sialidase family protein [Gemmatimonadales bacterium]|jgi:hypothetical protein
MRTSLGMVLLVAAACTPARPSFVLSDVEYARGAESGEPNLTPTDDGGALLTWLEPVADGRHALRVVHRGADGWGPAITVRESDRFFVNWADFPSALELADGTWLVHWLEKVSPATYAYHVNVAVSTDRGSTWSVPIVPHRDTSFTEHGFVSMVRAGRDRAGLIWLDGRDMNPSGELHDRGAMTVRFTTVRRDGTLGEEALLDARTCECCTTSLVSTESGLVAAYRDRSMEEIRDIVVVRLVDGRWTEPMLVGDDRWHYPGCPVNGPQLSAVGDTVALAWFAAPEQQARVQVAFSTDGGATFGLPLRVDDGRPSGRVDIELLADGSAVVAWLELTDADAEVRARRVTRHGSMDPSWLVAPTQESRGSGFPRMTRVGDELLFAWRLVGPDGGIRVAAARME